MLVDKDFGNINYQDDQSLGENIYKDTNDFYDQNYE